MPSQTMEHRSINSAISRMFHGATWPVLQGVIMADDLAELPM